MRDILFQYSKVGHIIMLDEKDWKRIVRYLAKSGVAVTKESRPTTRAADGGESVPEDSPFETGIRRGAVVIPPAANT
jgi:hypothetical protein